MDYASPAIQLLAFLVSLFIAVALIVASVLFLRDKGLGPWIMLTGSSFGLIAMIPLGISQYVNYHASIGYEAPEVSGAMYYTLWNWLPGAAGLVFATGLLLTAVQRRVLAGRIAELEAIIATRESIEKR